MTPQKRTDMRYKHLHRHLHQDENLFFNNHK